MTQEELEAIVDKELDETIKRVEREKKRALKKERIANAKQDVRKKMSVIAATSINNDEDLMLDQKTWDKLKSIEDAEDIQKYLPKNIVESEDDENMDPLERKYRFYNDGAEEPKQKGEDDSSSDEDFNPVKKIDRMAAEIDDSIAQQREYQMLKDKKTIKQEYKTKALIDLQRQKRQDESDDELLMNDEIMKKNVKENDPEDSEYSENDDDLEEEREILRVAKE